MVNQTSSQIKIIFTQKSKIGRERKIIEILLYEYRGEIQLDENKSSSKV